MCVQERTCLVTHIILAFWFSWEQHMFRFLLCTCKAKSFRISCKWKREGDVWQIKVCEVMWGVKPDSDSGPLIVTMVRYKVQFRYVHNCI